MVVGPAGLLVVAQHLDPAHSPAVVEVRTHPVVEGPAQEPGSAQVQMESD